MIEGRQIRAARALLGWSREDLVKAADVSISALLRLENEAADTRGSTLRKVIAALTHEGIEFVAREDGAVGVVLRRPES